jgi:hypothetical protein
VAPNRIAGNVLSDDFLGAVISNGPVAYILHKKWVGFAIPATPTKLRHFAIFVNVDKKVVSHFNLLASEFNQ